MQEEAKTNTPMVDIDTSGPSAEVELNEEAQTEEQVETKEQDPSPASQEASSEEQSEEDQKESKDKELENYSKDVQKEISRLGYEEVRLQELSQIAEEQKAIKDETVIPTYQPRQQEAVREVDPKAESWASNNRWFGSDKAMTYTAFDLHKTLVDEEGYDPKSDEYYVEIDNRMRVEFPHKFDTNNDTNIKGETTKPTQTVASATRSVKQSRKTISLTPSEVAIAKKLGVSLEDYAKQKKHMKEV